MGTNPLDSFTGSGTPVPILPHSQDSIRLHTMQLSGMEMGMFSPPSHGSLQQISSVDTDPLDFTSIQPPSSVRSGSVTPRNRQIIEPQQETFNPSGLSLLRPSISKHSSVSTVSSYDAPHRPPIPEGDQLPLSQPSPPQPEPAQSVYSPSESTPLLPARTSLKKIKYLENLGSRTINQVIQAVPAVVLGCLLNILDGVSYGMILFPTTPPFSDLGPMGVSMFFMSTIVAQLTYTLGGSGIAGANGSMMVHISLIYRRVLKDLSLTD